MWFCKYNLNKHFICQVQNALFISCQSFAWGKSVYHTFIWIHLDLKVEASFCCCCKSTVINICFDFVIHCRSPHLCTQWPPQGHCARNIIISPGIGSVLGSVRKHISRKHVVVLASPFASAAEDFISSCDVYPLLTLIENTANIDTANALRCFFFFAF